MIDVDEARLILPRWFRFVLLHLKGALPSGSAPGGELSKPALHYYCHDIGCTHATDFTALGRGYYAMRRWLQTRRGGRNYRIAIFGGKLRTGGFGIRQRVILPSVFTSGIEKTATRRHKHFRDRGGRNVGTPWVSGRRDGHGSIPRRVIENLG